ncbi:acetylcholine receptor subunit delta-like [Pecten maximus]|uniref:acetylcholine receptor subunit delta-like n=1 Tax=Pecten maximus TaxID=6579 RepID=UPI001458F958|nr:acetylcholine receptor subunit delta-like [Pecten maximus]
MGTFRILVFLTFVSTGLQNVDSTYTYAAENALRNLIFTINSYQIQARPTGTVEVNITLNIITFNSLDVRNQALTTTGYFRLAWSDRRLDWSNKTPYNSDINAIYSDEDTIWRPPLILENSVNDISVMSDDSIPIRVANDGTLSWTPSGIYTTQCETDVTFYPFDTQVCDISISTWGYTSSEITLNLDLPPVESTYFKENGEWRYISYSTSTTNRGRGGNSFSSVTFHLTLKRRPMYHILNTLTPTILSGISELYGVQTSCRVGRKDRLLVDCTVVVRSVPDSGGRQHPNNFRQHISAVRVSCIHLGSRNDICPTDNTGSGVPSFRSGNGSSKLVAEDCQCTDDDNLPEKKRIFPFLLLFMC